MANNEHEMKSIKSSAAAELEGPSKVEKEIENNEDIQFEDKFYQNPSTLLTDTAITVNTDQETTVSTVHPLISPHGSIIVCVETPMGDVFDYEANNKDTIEDIIKAISSTYNIPSEQMTLLIMGVNASVDANFDIDSFINNYIKEADELLEKDDDCRAASYLWDAVISYVKHTILQYKIYATSISAYRYLVFKMIECLKEPDARDLLKTSYLISEGFRYAQNGSISYSKEDFVERVDAVKLFISGFKTIPSHDIEQKLKEAINLKSSENEADNEDGVFVKFVKHRTFIGFHSFNYDVLFHS